MVTSKIFHKCYEYRKHCSMGDKEGVKGLPLFLPIGLTREPTKAHSFPKDILRRSPTFPLDAVADVFLLFAPL